jgi:hypothetical protein
VIRTTSEEVGGSEQLLPQQEPGQEVGHGHRPQRQPLIGLSEEIAIEAEVAADGKKDALDTLVRMLLQPPREGLAGGGPAPLVESHDPPTGLVKAHQRFGLDPQNALGIFVAPTGRGP